MALFPRSLSLGRSCQWVPAGVAVLVLAACGAPLHTPKLEKAQALLKAALGSPAARFAPAEFEAARAAVQEAEAELAKQKKKRFRRSAAQVDALSEQAVQLVAAAQQRGEEAHKAAYTAARDLLAKGDIAVIDVKDELGRLVRCHRESPVGDLTDLAKRSQAVMAAIKSANDQFQADQPIESKAQSEGALVEAAAIVEAARGLILGSSCSGS